MRPLFAAIACLLTAATSPLAAAESPRVGSLKVTILSTMLADGPGLGEWGFSALVEVDGHRLLFDTGAHPDIVLKNARALDVDLTNVPEVILSHSHNDHTGGLITLRQSVLPATPDALARVHVGEGIFYPRTEGNLRAETNPMLQYRPEFEQTGGSFIVHDRPVQLYPGVWLTGPVPRPHPERNWSGNGRVTTPAGTVEDTLPEDMALVVDTDAGLVVITGCGHAGIVNILDYARAVVRPAKIHAVIGGLHLFNASEHTLAWTSVQLKAAGVENLLGAHCTGLETVYRFRTELGLDRAHAVVGAVGASFELGRGIDPGYIAK